MAKENDRSVKILSVEARDKLLNYHFPGNVRELMNICQRSSIMVSGDIIKPEDIYLQSAGASKGTSLVPKNQTLDQIEAMAILQTLKDCADNKSKAAEILNITVKTLRAKLAKIA